MTEDQDVKDSHSDSGSRTFVNKSKDKKGKPQRPLTKIILRRLPPTMTEESFLEQVSPIPEHDHFYFAKPDLSLGNNMYSRAYINFLNVEDIYLFRDKFDGYIFLDEKGVEYVGIVEYAPFQRIPKKKKKKDPKSGTIESDPIFQEFIENLNKDQETENQPKLEYSYPINDTNDKKVQLTPLLEYLAARKMDKRGRDERRRRENDKRKMRIERKGKDLYIKVFDEQQDFYMKSSDLSEDDNDNKQCINSFWYGEQRIYRKTRVRCTDNSGINTNAGSDEITSTDSDWDNQFPALTMKIHNTFTITSDKDCNKKSSEDQKSGGDTNFKEEDYNDSDVKKIKPRDGEKSIDYRDDDAKIESKDVAVFESKTYKDQRKLALNSISDKKKKIDSDKKETYKDDDYEDDKFKKERRDKLKDSPRESKSKKYSDTRKERLKQTDSGKSDKQSIISKFMASEGKSKSLNSDEIKPFTQLPQVKTDDLSKMMEDMDRKMKLDENQSDATDKYELNSKRDFEISKMRRCSIDSGDLSGKEDLPFKRQDSLDDRRKYSDREGSEEKEKSESSDRRVERRIRNKDRPSLVIYQPGMGKFSKQRLAKEKETNPSTGKCVNDSEKKDT